MNVFIFDVKAVSCHEIVPVLIQLIHRYVMLELRHKICIYEEDNQSMGFIDGLLEFGRIVSYITSGQPEMSNAQLRRYQAQKKKSKKDKNTTSTKNKD